jgi:hypothetical protein
MEEGEEVMDENIRFVVAIMTLIGFYTLGYLVGRYAQTRQHIINLKEAELYDRRKFYHDLIEAVKGIDWPPTKGRRYPGGPPA